MRKEDCIEMFKKIPEEFVAQVNLALRNGMLLAVESVARFEGTYLVFRGREGGTTDEGRAFFVPYEDISYIKLERVVRLGELKMMYGETGYVDAEDRLTAATAAADLANPRPGSATPASTATPLPMPVLGTDPASIAKQNLLLRIRTARANVAGSATGKLGGGNK